MLEHFCSLNLLWVCGKVTWAKRTSISSAWSEEGRTNSRALRLWVHSNNYTFWPKEHGRPSPLGSWCSSWGNSKSRQHGKHHKAQRDLWDPGPIAQNHRISEPEGALEPLLSPRTSSPNYPSSLKIQFSFILPSPEAPSPGELPSFTVFLQLCTVTVYLSPIVLWLLRTGNVINTFFSFSFPGSPLHYFGTTLTSWKNYAITPFHVVLMKWLVKASTTHTHIHSPSGGQLKLD